MESSHLHSWIAAPKRRFGGFTLAELLVTFGIIAVIMGVAITNQSAFNRTFLLTDTTYSIALSAREAQSLGLSSRKFAGVQNGGYGLHFTYVTPTSYVIFADISSAKLKPSWCPITATSTPEARAGNCVYDDSSEVYQTYALTRGFKISDVCGKNIGSAEVCGSAGGLDTIDVLFLRPNTQAIITAYKSGAATQYSCATIRVVPPGSSNPQTMRITSTGEISVYQACP
jgi:type II secretory pathway pseudopilin PulG